MKLRTASNFAIDPDAAAVRFHKMLGYGKAEAGTADLAGACDIHTVEALEDARLVGLGDADPGVGHRKSNFIPVRGGRNHNLPSRGRVLNRVVQKILQDFS